MDIAATKIIGVTAVVDFEYKAQEPDELDLVKGDIIHSIKKMPGGWWQGTLQSNGKTGMFPDNFVRVIDTNDENTVLLRDKSSTANRRCKVVFSYTQVNDDELTLAVGDVIEFLGEVEEGWWRGRLKNKVGVFPSNFVVSIEPSPVFAAKRLPSTILKNNVNNMASSLHGQQAANAVGAPAAVSSTTVVTSQVSKSKVNRLSMHSSKEDLLATTSSAAGNDEETPNLPPKPQREYCRVEFPYAPQNDDELELKVGDIITIINMELPDKGWWKGELRGRIGVFPDNFVKLVPPSEVAPLNDQQPSHRTAKNVMHSGAALGTAASSTTNLTTASSSSSSSFGFVRRTGSSASSSSTTTATGTNHIQQGTTTSTATTTTATTSTNRKESFGSRDSLNDILSETGLPTGNVAAQRKSLENKNLDLSHPPMGLKKLQQHQHQQQHQQQQQHSHQHVQQEVKSIAMNGTSSLVTTSSVTTSSVNATASSSSSSSSTSMVTNELRKSLENLDDKTKTTPPPVLTKKPSVPNKKTSSVSSVAGNIFSGLKQKVKNVENKLTTAASHDLADGIGSSKMSPSNGLPDTGASGAFGVIRRANTIAGEDSEFDSVERSSILQDVRANRVKAPKRRPPSAAINVLSESSSSSSMYLNGNASLDSGNMSSMSEEQKVQSSDDNSTGEEQLAKPKPREWEKKKAPWMEELKASQVKKKTSPNLETNSQATNERTSLTSSTSNGSVGVTSSTSPANAALSASSASVTASSTTTKVQSSIISSSSIMQQSVNVESTGSGNGSPTRIQFYKKDANSMSQTTNHNADLMSKSLSSKLVTESVAANSSLSTEEIRSTRPNSLSINNRSLSPSFNASHNRTSLKSGSTSATENHNSSSSSTAYITKTSALSAGNSSSHLNHSNEVITNNINGTFNAASSSHATTNHLSGNSSSSSVAGNQRVVELEKRVDKLETIVQSQQRMIEELIRSLREETDRVRILRGELDKYAQCVTQV